MARSQRIGAGIISRPPALQRGMTARQAPIPAARSGLGRPPEATAAATHSNATGST
ncbi:hypothetical protein [Paludisphaera sp.]|uniref:hypothetical protein n=1 Tax=Paludisphaera sp. TaxID=2017432 RepID=UPI00301C94B1